MGGKGDSDGHLRFYNYGEFKYAKNICKVFEKLNLSSRKTENVNSLLRHLCKNQCKYVFFRKIVQPASF